MFGITSSIGKKHDAITRKLDKALRAARDERSEGVIAKSKVKASSSSSSSSSSPSSPVKKLLAKTAAPVVTRDEYQRRCGVLIARLRAVLAARYLSSEELRKQYLTAGIYSLIRSHAKEAITNGKMMPLIDHERELRQCEATDDLGRRWKMLVSKCGELGVKATPV